MMKISKKLEALVVIFSVLIFSSNVHARKKGAMLEIVLKNGTEMIGELLQVQPESLLLLVSYTEVGKDVYIKDIKTITIRRTSKALWTATYGFLIGAGIGTLASIGKGGETRIFYGGGLSILGAISGLFIGSKSIGETIAIEGKSDQEIKDILENLRQKALLKYY